MKTLIAFALIGSTVHAQVQEGTATCSNNAVSMCYGDHAACSLSAPSDIDVYRFMGRAGDAVRVTMSGSSINIDSRFEVLDPQGNPVASSSCATSINGRCSTSQDFTLTVNGQHTILASDSGQNEAGTYILDLQRLTPLIPDRFVEYGTPVVVAVGHISDHDFLSFEGREGDLVRISASGTSINLDSSYVLYAPDGSALDSGFCTTSINGMCSVTSDNLFLPADGTYSVMLHDAGWNETGNTSVTVTCLVGECPPNWTPVGSSFCMTTPNSSGNPATLNAWGSEDANEEALFLYASDTPANVSGIFFMSPNQIQVTLGDGVRCAGNPAFRFPLVNSCNRAELRFQPDFSNLPQGIQFLPGATWNFQAWFRDGPSSNTSDGLAVTFQ